MQTALIISLSLLVCAYAFAQREAPMGRAIAPNLGLIKGVVTDNQAPEPNRLAYAIVIVENESLLKKPITTETDEAGNYEIRNLPPGEYAVTVNKPGFDSSVNNVTVIPGGGTLYDVSLHAPKILLGEYGILWVLLIGFVIGIIYMISRRSSGKTQNGRSLRKKPE